MGVLFWFQCGHLPTDLQAVVLPFAHLAGELSAALSESPECEVALRKLLEAKDAAVRAAIECRRPTAIEPKEK